MGVIYQDPLLAALSTAQEAYSLANPESLKAHEEACSDFPGGNTRTVLHASPFPLTFTVGKGAELTSLDGKLYVDFLGEYTAGIFGHSNPKIKEAVDEAMGKGWNFGGPNVYERELARKVTKRFSPSGIELVRFTNSGTESNTMALAAAVAYTRRRKILAFKNGYHGGTLSFPSGLSPVNTNLPHDFVLAAYNDIEGTRSVLESLPKDSLAAIIVEGVQGSGGCIVGSAAFLHFLNDQAKELGALFIMDEVMTSRLSYHGLSALLNLKPDLVTLGKWVGGGMTFGAFGGRKEVMSMFDPRTGILGHSGTFNNNVVTMAAGCAGMDVYNEEAVQKLNCMAGGMLHRIEVLLEENSIRTVSTTSTTPSSQRKEPACPFSGINSKAATDWREAEALAQSQKNAMWCSGQGSMLNIHFSGPGEKSLRALFWHHMLECGIYIAQRGFVALNLEITDEHVDQFLDATRGFLEKNGDVLR